MPNEPWKPLDDEPLDAAQHRLLDAGRLQPVVDAMVVYVERWLGVRRQADIEPLCVGLFGGLGQGKTSAVCAALKRAEGVQRPKDRLRKCLVGPPVCTFNVSHYAAADLEWRLVSAVLLWRAVRNLLVWLTLFLGTGLLALLAYGRWRQAAHGSEWLANILRHLDAWWHAWPPAWVHVAAEVTGTQWLRWPLWIALGALALFYLQRLVTQPFHQHSRGGGVVRLARIMCAVPRILVVDDLDRADVTQQRAFLRALHRWTGTDHLKWGVIVCMDDAALAQSAPAPEAPEALVLKCLQVVLRLPDRQREDVVMLALSAAQVAVAPTRNPQFKVLLSDVQWLGALVRVLLAAYPPSAIGPRLIKHVLNDVMAHGCSLQGLSVPTLDGERDQAVVDDWCALLRLDGLLRLVPALRQDMPGVIRALEINTQVEFERLVEQQRWGRDDPRGRAGVDFLVATRMVQPSHREGWFGLLVVREGPTVPEEQTEPPQPAAPPAAPTAAAQPQKRNGKTGLHVNAAIYRYTQLYCALIDLGRNGYTKVPINLHPEISSRKDYLGQLEFDHAGFQAWMEFAPASCRSGHEEHQLPSAWLASDGKTRGAPAHVHEWLCWMAAIATGDVRHRSAVLWQLPHWIEGISDSPHHAVLTHLVTLERLANAEHWQGLPVDEQLRLLDAAGGCNGICVVAMDHGHLGVVLEALYRAPPPFDTRKVLRLLAPWGKEAALQSLLDQAGQVRDAVAKVHQGSPTFRQHLQHLAAVWPGLVHAGARNEEWAQAMRGALGRSVALLDWIEVVPQTWLHSWREPASRCLTTADCLRLLASIAKREAAVGSQPLWREAALRPWLDGSRPPSMALLPDAMAHWTGRLRGHDVDARLVAVLVGAILGWPPHTELLEWIEQRASPPQYAGMLLAFFQVAQSVSTSALLQSWDTAGHLVRSLRCAMSGFSEADRVGIAEQLQQHLGQDTARKILRDAGWPVPPSFGENNQ